MLCVRNGTVFSIVPVISCVDEPPFPLARARTLVSSSTGAFFFLASTGETSSRHNATSASARRENLVAERARAIVRVVGGRERS